MADEALRRLERAAAAGDYDAEAQLERARARTVVPPLTPLENVEMVIRAFEAFSFSITEALEPFLRFAATITTNTRAFNDMLEKVPLISPMQTVRWPYQFTQLRRSDIVHTRIRDPPA